MCRLLFIGSLIKGGVHGSKATSDTVFQKELQCYTEAKETRFGHFVLPLIHLAVDNTLRITLANKTKVTLGQFLENRLSFEIFASVHGT